MISLLLVALAGFFNACMDTVNFSFHISVFRNLPGKWWNKKESNRNKWKGGDRKNGERFPLSSTALVWLTDFWHLAQTMMIVSYAAAIVSFDAISFLEFKSRLLTYVIHAFVYSTVFGASFELFWSKVLRPPRLRDAS